MRKIRINYDFFDKIKETQGKCKIRRWIKNNKFQDAIIVTFTVKDIVEACLGIDSIPQTIMDIATYYTLLAIALSALELLKNNIIEKNTGKTQEDYAYDELNNLTALLNSINVDINIKELMNAEMYHKKYKLAMEGKPGIIRERYFEIETDNNNYDRPISLKEEHLMGSKNYELTVASPPKKRVFKLAYGMQD